MTPRTSWATWSCTLLHELGLLTDWGYRTACVNLSRLGYRSSKPGGIPHESSQLLT